MPWRACWRDIDTGLLHRKRKGIIMRVEQEKVRTLIREYGLDATASVRCLDLVSEVGETAKEILKATDYGKAERMNAHEKMQEELGDCLFSLLALCEAAGIDACEALESAMNKYHARWKACGSVGSGR